MVAHYQIFAMASSIEETIPRCKLFHVERKFHIPGNLFIYCPHDSRVAFSLLNMGPSLASPKALNAGSGRNAPLTGQFPERVSV